MKFSLIVCTYMRPDALLKLLNSVVSQSLYPDEILIIDGSTNHDTAEMLQENTFSNLQYFIVSKENRGLTRQRNFGISKVRNDMDVVCFLDDDIILEPDYFENLLNTYDIYPEASGAGGYIINESECEYAGESYVPKINEYYYDGWKRNDGSRFILRKKLGLDSNMPPGFSPEFSHGRSVSFLPPSGKIYEVEQLMGGVSSFRKAVFETYSFSTYFEGYGLYEDADFTLRVAKTGRLYLNTAARLKHFHDAAGRPNQYYYGKMVVRNGWYVWRVKNPDPSMKARIKWNTISLLLAMIRFSNTFTADNKKQALTEAIGRFTGWCSLLFNRPKISP
jgi:glycosyltransferase involved in cell wall biosynthesis